MREIEVKIRLRTGEIDAIRAALRGGGAQPGRIDDEENLLFDDASAGIHARRQTLRLRLYDGRSEAHLTFKGARDAASRFKSREELEVEVSDGVETQRILMAIGLQPNVCYRKHRENWTFLGTKVALDRLRSGDYLEVEGTEEGIDRVIETLDLTGRPHISAGYATLEAKADSSSP